jgi:hypothetical protein
MQKCSFYNQGSLPKPKNTTFVDVTSVVWWINMDVSEKTSNILLKGVRIFTSSEGGRSRFLRNVGTYPPDYTASGHVRQ